MSGSIQSRLSQLGITLPTPAAAVANYIAYVVVGDMIFVSGQLPLHDGKIAVTGKLGATVSVDQGYQAARLCAINLLAQAQAAAGDLARVRLVKLGAFVASHPDFTDQPKVVNGASDLMVEVLGERGRHARAAVGSPCLPLDAAVEIDAVFQIVE